jgi:uncharacterized membrane protein
MSLAAALPQAGGIGVTGDLNTLLLILALGLGTYATRIGGHLILSRFDHLNPRVEAALDACRRR